MPITRAASAAITLLGLAFTAIAGVIMASGWTRPLMDVPLDGWSLAARVALMSGGGFFFAALGAACTLSGVWLWRATGGVDDEE